MTLTRTLRQYLFVGVAAAVVLAWLVGVFVLTSRVVASISGPASIPVALILLAIAFAPAVRLVRWISG